MENSLSIASNLSVFICFFITYFYSINVQYFEAEYYTTFGIGMVRFILSFIQLIFTILFVFYWFQLKLWKDVETINREAASEE